jgi:GNAT superfamily N-acetyltransferase
MTTGIRLAVAGDSGALAGLRYEFRSALGPAVEDRDQFVARCERWMAERLSAGGAWRCWVAERDGALVGNVWLHVMEKIPNPVDEPEGHAYVTNVYVRESERGRGLGADLLSRAIAWCRERGDIQAVFLWPTERSRPLYARHGFAVREHLMELVL